MKQIFSGMILISALSAFGAEVRFTDVTQDSGIDFRYTFGDFTYDNILESSGSGVTVLDYDGDGDMDLYVMNGTYLEDISDPKGRVFRDTPNRLYRNQGNGTFTEVGRQAGVDDRHWSMAAAAMDYDGDGDVDLYLLNYGPNVFYRNNGDGTFTDIASRLGLRGPERLNGFEKWSVGAAFWDFDADGKLDVMQGNFLAFDPYYLFEESPHLMPHPGEYKGQASLLYRQGPAGRFRDVSKEMGFHYPDSKCMGLTVWDYDQDGDLDLFQGNDHQENFLFRNDGGVFREVGREAGIVVNDEGHPTGSMHGSIGDVDGDGWVDLFVTDLRYGALYRNRGDGTFEDITESSGLKGVFNGKGAWAAGLFDFDNDGDLDLFSANGMADILVDQEPLLLENDGTGHFQNVGPRVGEYFQKKRSGRGAVIWDYNDDGNLDIFISHIDLHGTPTLLRNSGGTGHHWLGITLVGARGAASTIAARVTVTYGGKTRTLVNQPANSYLSWNDPRLHIGLGVHDKIDSLMVHWNGGGKQVIRDVPVDQYLTLVEQLSQ